MENVKRNRPGFVTYLWIGTVVCMLGFVLLAQWLAAPDGSRAEVAAGCMYASAIFSILFVGLCVYEVSHIKASWKPPIRLSLAVVLLILGFVGAQCALMGFSVATLLASNAMVNVNEVLRFSERLGLGPPRDERDYMGWYKTHVEKDGMGTAFVPDVLERVCPSAVSLIDARTRRLLNDWGPGFEILPALIIKQDIELAWARGCLSDRQFFDRINPLSRKALEGSAPLMRWWEKLIVFNPVEFYQRYSLQGIPMKKRDWCIDTRRRRGAGMASAMGQCEKDPDREHVIFAPPVA